MSDNPSPEMSSQWYDKVVDPVAGVIGRQNDGLVLPLVLFRVPVSAVLAYLEGKKIPDERGRVRECPRRDALTCAN